MPVVWKPEPEITETLDKNEVVVTEPITEVKPIIEVPSKESMSFNIPKNYDGDFLAEGITIVVICAVLYGLFQLVVILIPLIVSLAFVGGIGYLGYLLM